MPVMLIDMLQYDGKKQNTEDHQRPPEELTNLTETIDLRPTSQDLFITTH